MPDTITTPDRTATALTIVQFAVATARADAAAGLRHIRRTGHVAAPLWREEFPVQANRKAAPLRVIARPATLDTAIHFACHRIRMSVELGRPADSYAKWVNLLARLVRRKDRRSNVKPCNLWAKHANLPELKPITTQVRKLDPAAWARA